MRERRGTSSVGCLSGISLSKSRPPPKILLLLHCSPFSFTSSIAFCSAVEVRRLDPSRFLTSHIQPESSCLISSASALQACLLLRLSTALSQPKPWSSLPGANAEASSLLHHQALNLFQPVVRGGLQKSTCDQYLQPCP